MSSQPAQKPTIIDALGTARKVIAADEQQRAAACEAAINAALREHGCKLVAEPVQLGPGIYSFQVVVRTAE